MKNAKYSVPLRCEGIRRTRDYSAARVERRRKREKTFPVRVHRAEEKKLIPFCFEIFPGLLNRGVGVYCRILRVL